MSAKTNLKVESYSEFSAWEQEELIKSYIPLVKRVVHRVAGRMPRGVDLKEMLNSGLIGLVDAFEKYDPSQETTFTTYAQFRIRGAILDSLRAQDWLPRSARARAHKIQRAYQAVEQRLGHAAEDADVAKELDITLEDFQKQLGQVSNAVMYSFEEMGFGHGDERFNHGREEPSPVDNMIAKERVAILARALERLSYKERLVITLHFYEELSLKEIGEILELTESRISQVRTKALIRLKNCLNSVVRGEA